MSPVSLSDRPAVDAEGDLLSSLLTPLRLRGAYHSRWSATPPWGVRGQEDHVAIIHYVLEGECVLIGEQTVRLRTGELALFPHGAEHDLADRPGRPMIDLDRLLPDRAAGGTDTVRIGGEGADGTEQTTTLLCGGLHYDVTAESPLYRALPRMLVLDAETLSARPMLTDLLRRLTTETDQRQPGSELATLRAFELVFVLALGIALESLDAPILRALRHPSISRALLAIQTRFDEPWTLETLAGEAGMSRSSFAATFRDLVGEAPARHLTGRRIQEAARLLVDTDLPQEAIGARIGYDSVVGFHQAFRKWFDLTPGTYRRRRR